MKASMITSMADPKYRRTAISLVALVAAAVLLMVSAEVVGRYQVSVLTTLLIYVVAASAWNLIGGVVGQFSLASSAMIGIGSYAAVMLLRDTTLPLPVVLLGAAVVGALFSAVVGILLFRLRGFYFTVGTLAVSLVTLAWMTTWEVTGATTGISAPLSSIPSGGDLYRLSIVVAAVTVAISAVLVPSALGLRMMAVRDDEDIADSLGIVPFRMKMIAMVLSGALIAVAGAMFALQRASIEPFSSFSLTWSITIVVMVIVGGLGSVWGPVIGALVIYYGITVQFQSLPAIGSLVSGVLLIVVIKFLPGGIVAGIASLQRFLFARFRRGGRPTDSVDAEPIKESS